ncbi:glycosyl transferase [Candidatus Woesearchaeota archaeon CG11_big_fil_rev_8_21_14_0_20_43_8]|nr:MAG: glycosyl transferase [Candidatus Woesearchaeota archaeon CG11_big_fil_rev_8_21_14_0_20_43_8]PIO05554.1 MAG: glycosyltransferase family 9 protein [Candidatus Woesearchaeota archaeon CG08_land_8_20_14_0_20_43_7]
MTFIISFQRAIDRYIGALICLILNIVDMIISPSYKRVKIDNILIVRLWAIGETILVLPMIERLRKEYPKAKISVLTTPRVKEVFESVGFIDEIMVLGWDNRKLFKKFDMVFDTEPFLRISAIMAWFTGKKIIGFDGSVRSLLYSVRVPYNDRQHVVQVYLDMLREIGIKAEADRLVKLMFDANDESIAKQLVVRLKKPIIGICATSAESAGSRRWPQERFAELSDQLIKDFQASIIFFGIPSDEKYNDEIIDMISESKNVLNAAGKTTLKQLYALIERCDLVVSNDTGPMHISAAMDTKTLGLFGPNTPVRFAPYGSGNESIYIKHQCSPCINVHKGDICDCRNPICIEAITVANVFRTIKRMLRKNNKNQGSQLFGFSSFAGR